MGSAERRHVQMKDESLSALLLEQDGVQRYRRRGDETSEPSKSQLPILSLDLR